MTSSSWLATGALLGAAGVALGAFGAHGLKTRVGVELLVVFETAVRYHLIHALAIIAVAWSADRWPGTVTDTAGWLFVFGILIFSGSLYILVLTGQRWLGAITPVGGVALIAGWCTLALAAWRSA
jgi:uncharacterized membrane protein YgdD (TMEM256/DUF423 family)